MPFAPTSGPRQFPIVTTPPRLPVMIPDEILDYYGWVFCQGGFVNLQMTFEQFLTVIAAVSPSGLCPEYEDGGEMNVHRLAPVCNRGRTSINPAVTRRNIRPALV